MSDSDVPTHQYPEDAARTLAQVMRHVDWRGRAAQEPPEFEDVHPDEAAALIAKALETDAGWMGFDETARLLGCYGVAMPEWRTVPDPESAGRAAEDLGSRVALKAQGAGLVHKTEMGAVRIGLSGGPEVTQVAEKMDDAIARAGAEREDFIVQAMIEGGVELLVGVVDDATFGPVLACGAGGTQAELLKDVAVRICPITLDDARQMLRSLATFPLLTGYRGTPEANLDALEEMLLRVSAMVEAHHEIAELDLNPVLARPDGAIAIDARVRLKNVPPPRPWPATWR